MKNLNKYFLLVVFITISYSCADFEELEKNPNRPAEVPASLIFRGILANMVERPWNSNSYWNQFWCVNYNYYGTNEYWTNTGLSYSTLSNAIRMEEIANKAGDVNPYSALSKFFRAYFFVYMTQRVGDLPLNDALKGLENKTPVYNTQKEIYLYVLDQLEQANNDLKKLIDANDLSLAGDIFYNNNLTKWQKAVNSFKLRVLISLSKKEADVDLQVKAKFAAMLADPAKYPIMTSNADNMNYVFNGSTQIYPTNPGNRGFDKGRYNMAQTYMKGLTDLKDPRVFVVSNPAKALVVSPGNGTLQPDDFGAYQGAPSGESLDDMSTKASNGLYSYANQKRYYTTLTGPEPAVQMGYWEVCFNVAEGLNRGWGTGNADTYYQNGIKASMNFLGISDGASISITDQDGDVVLKTISVSLTNYLTQPEVIYAGNNATGLAQILNQKYLAFFQNSGLEAYFNYRRTGVPAFHQGPGTGNSGVIPRRWLYPNSEAFYNSENYKAALQKQFGNQIDDVDNELWINK